MYRSRAVRDCADADADLFGDHWEDVGEACRQQSEGRRDHGSDAERHRSCRISQKAHPTRYFDVGIAEEHAALFACGTRDAGTDSRFSRSTLTFFQRAYDMAIHDMAIQKLNVAALHGPRRVERRRRPDASLACSNIGYLRHIPNWLHMQPKDEDEFVDMLWTMANYNSGPIAVRYPRAVPAPARKSNRNQNSSEIGKAEVVKHGRDVAIFGLGNMFEVAEEAARNWKKREFQSR